MGGGKSVPKATVNPFEKQLAAMSGEMYKASGPLRDSLYPQMQNVLQGGYDVTQNPQYRPAYTLARGPLESQYNVARENVMGSTPRGGGLTKALTGIEQSRAQQVGSLPSQIGGGILSDLTNKAYGTAFSVPGQAMQGLGSAASTFGSRQSAQMQAHAQANAGKSGMFGSLGQGLGMLGGMLLAPATGGMSMFAPAMLAGTNQMQTF